MQAGRRAARGVGGFGGGGGALCSHPRIVDWHAKLVYFESVEWVETLRAERERTAGEGCQREKAGERGERGEGGLSAWQ